MTEYPNAIVNEEELWNTTITVEEIHDAWDGKYPEGMSLAELQWCFAQRRETPVAEQVEKGGVKRSLDVVLAWEYDF